MSIQDLAAIGEIIGSLAVVVTLMYLAILMRDNNQETKASTTQQVLDSDMSSGGNRQEGKGARQIFWLFSIQ